MPPPSSQDSNSGRDPSSPLPVTPTVLVIGGSGVIGRAISLRFAEERWRVGVHYRTRRSETEETIRLAQELGGEAKAFQADVRDFQQVHHMVQALMQEWDRLDVLVCAAGKIVNTLAVRLSPENWEEVIHTNLTGVFFCLKACGPILLSQGEGSIIVIGSLASMQGTTGQTAYAASKAGLLGLVKTAAREWGPGNIRVNAIFPGWHQSTLSGESFPNTSNLGNHILGRTSDLKEVANSVYQIARLRDVTGQIFNLDSRIW